MWLTVNVTRRRLETTVFCKIIIISAITIENCVEGCNFRDFSHPSFFEENSDYRLESAVEKIRSYSKRWNCAMIDAVFNANSEYDNNFTETVVLIVKTDIYRQNFRFWPRIQSNENFSVTKKYREKTGRNFVRSSMMSLMK